MNAYRKISKCLMISAWQKIHHIHTDTIMVKHPLFHRKRIYKPNTCMELKHNQYHSERA